MSWSVSPPHEWQRLLSKSTVIALALRLCCPWEWFAQRKIPLTTMLENYAALVPKEYICHSTASAAPSIRSSGQALGAAVGDEIPLGSSRSVGIQEAGGLPWWLMEQDKLSCNSSPSLSSTFREREGKEKENPIYQIFNIILLSSHFPLGIFTMSIFFSASWFLASRFFIYLLSLVICYHCYLANALVCEGRHNKIPQTGWLK